MGSIHAIARQSLIATLAFLLVAMPSAGQAQDGDLLSKLSNPIASLTLIPIQIDYDAKIGPDRAGSRVTTLVQPVTPFKLDSEWSLVVRTIVPIIGQRSVFAGAGSQFGLGDTIQSFFFVPQTVNGFTWGAGPVALWRTGTDTLLTTGKWGAGPTAVALQQTGAWTFGALANHIWSYAGDGARKEVNSTYIQPFISYTSGDWTYALNTESTYDWNASQWSVPINAQIFKLTKIGNQNINLQAGLRYWAQSPTDGPHGLGGRLGITFILP
jgi:hypothetical protein